MNKLNQRAREDLAMPVVDPPDGRALPDNSVMVLKIRYGDHPKVWTYLAYKVSGRWFGTGTMPTDAGWGAMLNWLRRYDRRLIQVWTYLLNQATGEISPYGVNGPVLIDISPGADTQSPWEEGDDDPYEADDEPNAGWPPMSSEDM